MPPASDFLGLDPTEVPRRELASWLTSQVRDALADGTLAPGSPLPPTRQLAAELGVARGVVVEAYRRLADEGLTVARPRTGTVIAPAAPRQPAAPPTDHDAGPSSERHAMMSVHTAPRAELDLTPGLPELSHFPRSAWLRAERAVLDDLSPADLGYGDPRGALTLRRELSSWLARTRGLRATAEDVVITSGVAQGLTIASLVLRSLGIESVGFEDPGSRGARDTFAFWGMDLVPVPVDARGADVDAVARTGVRSAFLTPAHQYPTGAVLHPDRRRALVEWAHATTGYVIEDDYDAEHRYDRAPVAALQRLAPERVLHLGSVSKILAPGLRIGWLVPPPELRAAVLDVKYALDLGSPSLPQHVLARLLASGAYERHQRLARQRQRERRDALVDALRRYAPGARIEGVAAGLHLLLTFAEDGPADDRAVAEQARRAGVSVHPLSQHRLVPGPPGLVLGYGALTPSRLVEAARRIGPVIAAR